MFDVADHHFVVGLLAPADGFSRVRVGGVVRAVVEDGGDGDGAAAGNESGLGVLVVELPVEVVARDIEEGFGFSVRGGEFVFEAFSADVHVGHEAGDVEVEGDLLAFGLHVVGGVWRDVEAGVGDGGDVDFVERWLVGEDEAEGELVCGGFSVRCVVDLEAESCACGEAFGEAIREEASGVSGDVCGEVAALAFATAGDFRAFRVHVDDDVVDDAGIGGDDFVAADPAFLAEGGFDDLDLIGHHTFGGDVDGFGNLEDDLGSADGPTVLIDAGKRGFRGISKWAIGAEPVEQRGLVGGC